MGHVNWQVETSLIKSVFIKDWVSTPEFHRGPSTDPSRLPISF